MPRPNLPVRRPTPTGPAFTSDRMAAPLEQRVAWLEAEVAALLTLCGRLVEHADWAGHAIEASDADISRLKRWGLGR